MKYIIAVVTTASIFTFSTASPASATGFCEQYPEILTVQELRTYSDGLRWPLPARYALLLNKVEVRNDPDAGTIAPRADIPLDGRTPPSILVPRGFKKLSCRLLQLAAAQAANLLPDLRSPAEEFDDCARRGGGSQACLERVLIDRTAKIDSRYKSDYKYQEEMRVWVESSFKFVLAHEAAHIVLGKAGVGHVLTDRLGTEVAADLQATLSLAAYHNGNVYPAYAQFAAWAIIDPSIDWTHQNHVPMACRASIIASIYSDIVPQIDLVARWAYSPKDFDKYRNQLRNSVGRLSIARDASRCSNPVANPLQLVRADLIRLLGAIEATRKFTPAEGIRTIDTILAARLQTHEIRGVRASAVANRSYLFLSEELGEVVAKDMAALNDTESVSKKIGIAYRVKAKLEQTMTAMLNRVENELDGRLISADSYARFVAGNELIRPKTGAGSAADRIQGKIRFVEQYAPGTAVIPFLHGILAFKRRDCMAGRKYFLDAMSLDPDYRDQLSEFIGYGEPGERIDKEDCKAMSWQFR